MKEKLVIIDGSSLLYRAFYAIPMLTDSRGNYTNAVYGFLNMLLKLYEELQPNYVAVAFDKDKHTFRNDMYDGYKATRKPAPDELRPQFALIREVLASLGIAVVEMDGYEGDDILGTIATHSVEHNLDIAIVTGDRDALQLVNDQITVYLTKKGITTMLAVTPDVMVKEYGYTPEQVVDMKSLMGDTADNIPGVPGVGEKTARKLIEEFGSIDGIYANVDNVTGNKLKEKLKSNEEMARLSKKLATIHCDVPISYTLDMFVPKPNEGEAGPLFRQLGLQSLLYRFAGFDCFSNLGKSEKQIFMASIEEVQFLPTDMAGKVVAVGIQCNDEKPVPCIDKMVIVIENKGMIVPNTKISSFIKEFGTAKQIITLDGKLLYKAMHMINAQRIPVGDVVLAAYLLDPTRSSYDIAYLAERFDVDALRREKRDLLYDTWGISAVWEQEKEALQTAGLMNLYDNIEKPLLYTLGIMESNGFTVNMTRLEVMKKELVRQAEQLENTIYDAAGESFNINSPKQLGHILFEVLRLPVMKKTKTGYSTNIEVLEALLDKHPIIDKIIRFRTLKKLISTYLEGLKPLVFEQTGRVYTSFNQMVTATGRLSSSDPNLQNIPIRTEQGKKIRSLFVPGKGFDYIVSGDYSQIELRILAHLSQDPTMIDGFKKNQDIHRRTASEVFGIPMEKVTAEERAHAKAVNFGIIYGISDFGLSRNIGISIQQAKVYIESYFARYSTIQAYMEKLIEDARTTGITRTMFGRLRSLGDIHSKNFARRSMAERMAMNTPIQGSAADIIKLAMNAVQVELEKAQLRSQLLVQVHDELVLEVPKEELDIVQHLLKTTMEGIVSLSVPLVVDLHYGSNWEEAK